MLRLGFRGLAVFFTLVFISISEAALKPLRYEFLNGSQLTYENGELRFTPAPNSNDLSFQEKITLNNLILAPEGHSTNSSNPHFTTLSPTPEGPIVVQTPKAQAVPVIWTGKNNIHSVAFVTENGKFIELDTSQITLQNFEIFTPLSFAYKILELPNDDFVIVAVVGRKNDNMPTNLGHPWIISSNGTQVLYDHAIQTNFVFTYDEQSQRGYFEKGTKKNKLLDVHLGETRSLSHTRKTEIPNWEEDPKHRPRLSIVLGPTLEWLSDTQGKLSYLRKTSTTPPTGNNAGPNAQKPKPLTPMPEVQLEAGRKVSVDKVIGEFTQKIKLEDTDDFGFTRNDFRSVAVSLFSNPAGSIVVTGDSGGGKTTYVESFMRSVLLGEFADKGIDPNSTEFIHFSSSSLTSGTTLRGAEEARVEALIKYAEWAKNNGKNVIFYIDEIQNLTSSGSSNHDGNDVFQSFLSSLAKGTFKILGTTTDEGYLQIASRPDLERRLPALALKPIPIEDVPSKLENSIRVKKKEPLSIELLTYITQIAVEFDSTGEPISKASRLLNRLYREADFDSLEMSYLETNRDYILDVAARFYGYNVQNFTLQNLDAKVAEIQEKLNGVVGFEEIKEKVLNFHIRTVTRSRMSSKAEGRFLLISPKGLGKSTTVEAVANSLGRPYVRIPLSAYSDKEMLYSDIARAAKKNPYSVIFFDELGDAPRDIIIALNSALDAQKISADINYGKTGGRHFKTSIDLGRTLIFAATNSGATLIEDSYKKAQTRIGFATPEIEKSSRIEIDIETLKKRAVAEGLVESLIDRFEVVPVLYYSEADFRKILSIHYDGVFSKINKRNQLNLSLDSNLKEGYLDYLMKKHFSVTASPRAAVKELEETIENYFALKATEGLAPDSAEKMASACKSLLGK